MTKLHAKIKINKRLVIVFILGFSSGLPFALLSSTLQAWFSASGMSIFATGFLSLLGLPYIFRMFWAPLLDRFSLLSIGRRRSWIMLMQGLLLTGFNLMAWLNPTTSPLLLITVAFILVIFSATQDAAIDAHRTEYLPIEEHGLGASLAVLGYRLAILISGGLALIIAQAIGWAAAYRMMGFLMGVGLLAIILSREPSVPKVPQVPLIYAFSEPIKELFSRANILILLIFVFFYKIGEAFTTSTSGIIMPFLIQELGFSLDTIAYVNKIVGLGSVMLGGLISGLLLMRWSLYRSLMVFGLLQAITNVLFIILAIVGKSLPILMLAVICDNFAAGMGSIALVALFMRLVDKRFTATQFSILIAFSTLPRILSGPIGAALQSWFGWVGMYQIAFVLSLVFVPLLIKIKNNPKSNFIYSN